MILMNTYQLPLALERIDSIKQLLTAQEAVGVFLDYDGTLTPIVNHPEDALLSGSIRDAMKLLASRCTVAVISGRGLKDVRERVGLEEIFYAGSHGFEIAGPEGWYEECSEAVAYIPVLNRLEQNLRKALNAIKGLEVERKRFSIAVHYRRAEERDLDRIQKRVQAVQKGFEQDLRLSPGKCVYDFQPKIDWHKGKALYRVLEKTFAKTEDVFVIYLGDDITDEDAFRGIKNRGLGIVVREEIRETDADYALESPDEVGRFLEFLIAALPERK
jgi:trehalose-phosphatase